MNQERLRHILVKNSTHAKAKLYSQLSGMNMYELADKAMNEYIERHPLKGEKQDKWFEELVKSM